jgi:hypothetical protein
LLLYILVFSYIFYNSTINTVKFKSFVEVYPIEGNPVEVYPIEAYLIGKGVVEVSGCSPSNTCSAATETRDSRHTSTTSTMCSAVTDACESWHTFHTSSNRSSAAKRHVTDSTSTPSSHPAGVHM